ncbi:MAG: ABC transporter permease [Rhodovulum sulfidophilum]|uniref:ABC transporter permease n=1 Tax=Rhodovulum sulfidophilum TaxID=35806 RepID=A0A2W5N2W5_RHOSU|nr:MAG: ABC transporter permease [Rhodovulum sulfidophilum]
MLRFILADLRRGWPGALAIALIVACATALGLVVTLQERALRLGSARAANAFDLVIGAPGSETQLVLSSVFLQPAPLPLMPGSVLAGLIDDPRVAWAAPVGFGDQYEGRPVVGTSQALVDGLGGLASGATFARLGDAVVGADVPLDPGATFHPVHAELASEGEVHQETTYTVTGRLARTGSPWDRAILVPIEAVWRTHGLDAGEGEHDHEHDHAALDAGAPIRPEALADPGAPGLPAIVVRGHAIADAYNLRQDYRAEQTIAVFPAEVLTRLYGTLGDARAVVGAIALAAQALVAAAILLVAVIHVVQRHRQIGALRAFGAARSAVFAIVWIEVVALAAAGIAAGIVLGYVAARLIAARLTAASGLAFPVEFGPGDATLFLGLLLAAGICALIPAAIAYRQSPAAALRG